MKVENENLAKINEVISDLNVMNKLTEYNPTLCGTYPLGIDIETSDIDIIMEVYDFIPFKNKLNHFFSHHDDYKLKETTIRHRPVMKANFFYKAFEFELFGQPQKVEEQYAYLHMIIEKRILEEKPELKQRIIELKKGGYKTELAFCKVLNIQGDPYDELINYGKRNGYI